MKKLRVVLAEDHGLVRAGLRSLLESMEGVEVVAEAADGEGALEAIERHEPDVALMDISMPRLNGIEATRRAVKSRPRSRVLVVSMHADRQYVRRALAAGASGYVLKSADREELRMAIAAVGRGDAWLSPVVARIVVDDLARNLHPAAPDADAAEVLTPRQREILQMVAEGSSSKEIAGRLRISVKTVECHRGEIMDRVGVHDVAGLVRYAVRSGVVSAE